MKSQAENGGPFKALARLNVETFGDPFRIAQDDKRA
jgi:hypothetical protein